MDAVDKLCYLWTFWVGNQDPLDLTGSAWIFIVQNGCQEFPIVLCAVSLNLHYYSEDMNYISSYLKDYKLS